MRIFQYLFMHLHTDSGVVNPVPNGQSFNIGDDRDFESSTKANVLISAGSSSYVGLSEILRVQQARGDLDLISSAE